MNEVAPAYSPEAEALDHAHDEQEDRRHDAYLRVGRQQRDHRRRSGHDQDRPGKGGAPADLVADAAPDDAADRTDDEGDREDGEGGEKRRWGAISGKKAWAMTVAK